MSAWVYILRGSNGRHYIGSTVDVDRRLAEHKRGHTHTTRRLGQSIEMMADRPFKSLAEARRFARWLKSKKNPELAIYHLNKK